MEPATGERRSGCRLGVEVAEHQMWAAVGDFTHRSDFDGIICLIEDGGFNVHDGPSRCPGMRILLVRSQRGSQGGHLRLAVEIPQSEVG